MEGKFIKNFIEEQKHKEFLGEEKFGEELFDKTESLLKIYIVPLSVSQEKIDLKEGEMIEWLMTNNYLGNPWHHFIDGIRTMNFTEEKEELSYVLSIFKNTTLSYCGKLPYSNQKEKFISPQEIANLIKNFMAIAGKFYEKRRIDVPVKIYFQLIKIKNLTLNSSNLTTPGKYSLELEGKWHKENLIFNEESSTEEIYMDYPKTARKIGNRMVQAFGIWSI